MKSSILCDPVVSFIMLSLNTNFFIVESDLFDYSNVVKSNQRNEFLFN